MQQKWMPAERRTKKRIRLNQKDVTAHLMIAMIHEAQKKPSEAAKMASIRLDDGIGDLCICRIQPIFLTLSGPQRPPPRRCSWTAGIVAGLGA